MPKITPCLWYDTQAEEAAEFYCSVFESAKLGKVVRFGASGPGPEGSAMTVSFELDGLEFTALNGGPHFTFNEAVSMHVSCDTQAEVDAYWSRLTADGGAESRCGWLKDKFGVSWQIIPKRLGELLSDPDPDVAARVMQATLAMTKIDIAAIEAAAAG